MRLGMTPLTGQNPLCKKQNRVLKHSQKNRQNKVLLILEFIHPDGDKRVIKVDRHGVYNEDDALISVDGLVIDITQDIKGQTMTTLDKVDALLEQAGSDREHILSATIYLKTMDDFVAMNEAWESWVPEGFAPARACVQAAMAREALLFEVSIVAIEK